MNVESKSMKHIIIVMLSIVLVATAGFADVRRLGNSSGLAKANTLEFILYDANQIRSWVGNNGHIVSHIPTGDAGLEWPKGSGYTSVFASGLWVAGTVDGDVRSAAAEFTSEFQPGIIIYDPVTGVSSGPDSPNDARFQVSSIDKSDNADVTSENFSREFATWPAADGAPAHDGEYFTDANDNGVWDIGEEYLDFDVDGVYDGPDGVMVSGEDPPLMIGDQMHWFVINDAEPNTHSNLWSTEPLGIEVQTTVFGFDRADPLGNVMFVKWLVINKSGGDIDDMYLSIWSDADLGDATDDYVGCDTTLSVGYFYNGGQSDQDYGSRPPSVGYDFFQGPIVPSVGDTALISGREIADFRNLPMTSFVYYINGDPFLDDPETADEAYNYMQGLSVAGEVFHERFDPALPISRFIYPGDPNTRSGWTAYDDLVPGDMRGMMSSGPFDMATWIDDDGDGFPQVGEPGVQEIVSAIIIAAGTNNTNAIDAMKFFDQFAQGAYDAQFVLPSPLSPKVLVSELDEQIVLSWAEGREEVEAFSELEYNFEGYNVYQGESENGPWTLVATYDIENLITTILDKNFNPENGLILEAPVQFGNDTGIEILIDLQRDHVRGNIDLVNGRKYYYAVSSYAYSDTKAPKTVESSKRPITVRPHAPALGLVLEAATGDSVLYDHVGIAEASISAEVFDPLQLTGETYAVDFLMDSTDETGYWMFGKTDANDALLDYDDPMIFSSELGSYESDLIDGFVLTVGDVSFEAPKFKTDWMQTINQVGTQTETLSLLAISPGGVDSLAWTDETMTDTVHLSTLYGEGNYYDRFEVREVITETYFDLIRSIQHDVLIQAFASGFGGQGGDRLADIPGIGGGNEDIETLQADLEIRFTEQGQNASLFAAAAGYVPRIIHVPYEIWDIERNIQLCVGINDNNRSGGNQDTTFENWEFTLDLDWVIVYYQDYAEYGDSTNEFLNNPNSGWCWQFNSASKFSVGDAVQITFLNPVNPGYVINPAGELYVPEIAGDRWLIRPTVLSDATADQKKEQLEEINVFPNPYFAFNVEETQPLDRFVTFTHLPDDEAVQTTIRIYSLGGHFVRSLDHNGDSGFSGTSFEQWDLTNNAGIPVASGMYIAHIQVEGVGNKILKLAVFQPEERLDVY
ncbi:MAG: hypothetical protein HQ556_11940 [Candidatus Marinimicrobia bacterium]|nr:hypothetical protein [Candidatus Neomarinimicrobiota bacterium]